VRLFSPMGGVVVSSLPYRRGQDGVYRDRAAFDPAYGLLYFGGYGPKGLAGAGQSAYRDAVSGGEGVLLSGGALGESAGGLVSLDWRGRRPGKFFALSLSSGEIRGWSFLGALPDCGGVAGFPNGMDRDDFGAVGRG